MIKPWTINSITEMQSGEKWVDYSVTKIVHAECCKKTITTMNTVIVVPIGDDVDEYLYKALKQEGWVE